MDPASSSPLSTLSHPQPPSSSCCSSSSASPAAHLSELPSTLQKPPLSHSNIGSLPHSMQSSRSPFSHLLQGTTSPAFLYDGAFPDAADDSIEHAGFTGGDHPLLTSSWEALDRLASSSMSMGACASAPHQLPDFPGLSCMPSLATLQCVASPSSLSEVDQKPLSSMYGSSCQKGSNVWSDITHADAGAITTPTAHAVGNVGLNLASLICEEDPGFVERAAKFSSYSQQINSQAYSSVNQLHHMNKSGYINSISKAANHAIANGAGGARKLAHNNTNAANHIIKSASSNVPLQRHDHGKNGLASTDNNSSINDTNMHSTSPQALLSGAKKKREVPIKGPEEDDSGDNPGRKKAKVGEEDQQDASNASNNSSKLNSKPGCKAKVATNEKTKQPTGRSNSGESEQKSDVSNNNKTPSPSPPPKPDYIHVRARRGQATDSHSLAERVRREKISERMKYLQDLVPGCTKVTGKAMMLDEIINYVQSLQRQVEFLSMKLAAVHPSKLEFNFESLFGKEMGAQLQPSLQNNHSSASIMNPVLDSLTPLNPPPFLQENMQSLFQHHPMYGESMCAALTPAMLQNSLGSDAFLRKTLSTLTPASSDNFGECISQISNSTWGVDDDLVPLASFSQSPLSIHSSLQGTALHGQMKTEL